MPRTVCRRFIPGTLSFCTIALILGPVHSAGVDPPQELRVGGLLHEPLGSAILEGVDSNGDGAFDRAVLSNIGSSSDDGVRVTLSASVFALDDHGNWNFSITGWTGTLDFGPARNLPPGQAISITGRDQFELPVPGITISATDSGDAAISVAAPCPSCTFNVQACFDGALVADVDLAGDANVLVTGDIGSSDDSDVGIQFMNKAELVELVLANKKAGFESKAAAERAFDRCAPPAPPPSEDEDRSGGASGGTSSGDDDHFTISIGGGPLVPADAIWITVFMPDVAPETVPSLATVDITATNVPPGGAIAIRDEAVYVSRLMEEEGIFWFTRMDALGQAHITGVEVCEESSDPAEPPICKHAIELTNLGASSDNPDSEGDGIMLSGKKDMNWLPTGRDALAGRKSSVQSVEMEPGMSIKYSGQLWDTTGPEAAPSSGAIAIDVQSLGRVGSVVSANLSERGVTSGEALVFDASGALVASSPIVTDGSDIVMVLPGADGLPPRIASLAEGEHCKGTHMPCVAVEFAEPALMILPNGLEEFGRELRVIADTPTVHEGTTRLTTLSGSHASGGGGGTGKVSLTDIHPTSPGFTEGYVFGFHHQALDGVTLGVAVLDKLPAEIELNVSSAGSDGGSVIIDYGDGMERAMFSIRPWMPIPDEFSQGYSISLLSADSPFAPGVPLGEAIIGGCPNPDDPLCDDFMLGSGAYYAVDYSNIGLSHYLVEFLLDREVVAELTTEQTPVLDFGPAGDNPDATFTAELYCEQMKFEYNVAYGIGWNPDELTPTLRNTGQSFSANEMRVTSVEPAPEALNGSGRVQLSRLTGTEITEALWATIIDEAVGLFGLQHRTSGAGRLQASWSGSVYEIEVIEFSNPSHGYPAKLSSTQFAGDDNLFPFDDLYMGFAVTDPCTGVPGPCDPFPNGASLELAARVVVTDADGDSSCSVVQTILPGGEIRVNADFSELGAATHTVEVLQGKNIVGQISGHDVTKYAFYEGWPCKWYVPELSAENHLIKTLGWDRVQVFTFPDDGGAAGAQSFEGDALRFIPEGIKVAVGSIAEVALTTVNIPEVLITEMAIGDDKPQPIPCPADITGDNVVDIFDLLAVLACWGPVPPGSNCAEADVTGDNVVDIFDLLFVLANWGPCPR